MHLDLTDEETAALLRELDSLIAGDPLLHVAAYQDPESNPRQDPTGAGARAVASAAEAICATAGDGEAETGRWALSCENHPIPY